MKFQRYNTGNHLSRNGIFCLWELSGGQRYTESILPQGVIEIVFNLAEPIRAKLPKSNTIIQAPLSFIQGIHTHTLKAYYEGLHHLFGVRLNAFAVKRLLGVSSSELGNQSLDIMLIRPNFREIWNQLGEAKTFQERVGIIEKSFEFKSIPTCPRSTAICDFFRSGTIDAFQSVDILAKEVCYSTRQLNRKSHEFFGLSAEELVLYKKYMYAVNLMHQKQAKLGEIAHESGFSDHPHFSNVFKSFTSLTPKAYRSQSTKLPFHLFI